MYHKVGVTVREPSDRFLNVSASSFRRQMSLLRRLGYTAVTFEEAARGLAGAFQLPRRPVCITFDDAYSCVAEIAFPILRDLRWPGVVFVPTDFVGRVNGWDQGTDHPFTPIMGWDELRGLAESGWEVAGHTRSHPRLANLDDSAAAEEICAGKRAIEGKLDRTVETFCYPYGSYNERTPDLVRGAGFIAACTTKSGIATRNSNPLLLPRVKVAYRDGVAGFLYRLLIRPAMKRTGDSF
jgi:peptidoglycan/xylan/chitin deacetylase (PgdA/CDA1 family)